jgi:hypothetical protein
MKIDPRIGPCDGSQTRMVMTQIGDKHIKFTVTALNCKKCQGEQNVGSTTDGGTVFKCRSCGETEVVKQEFVHAAMKQLAAQKV